MAGQGEEEKSEAVEKQMKMGQATFLDLQSPDLCITRARSSHWKRSLSPFLNPGTRGLLNCREPAPAP